MARSYAATASAEPVMSRPRASVPMAPPWEPHALARLPSGPQASSHAGIFSALQQQRSTSAAGQRWCSVGMVSGRRRSGGQDGLDLQVQGDLVADHDPAVLQGGVEADVEVTPGQLAAGGEPGPGAAVRVRPETVQLED